MLNNRTINAHYHVAVDKDDNVMCKYPSKRFAMRYAKAHPGAIAVKRIEHNIIEEIVWRKGGDQNDSCR